MPDTLTFPNPASNINRPGRFTLDTLWVLIGLGVAVRLVFLGVLNLLPEEAYYWNYASHLDIGYLDHPPMVGWLIYLSEALLGRSEFAVRLPAFLGWFLFAYFMYRIAENTTGKGVGKPVILLLTVLPIYMSVGFLMTPDAPFYVCWAGALYFLERAIFGGRPSAWYGVGVCLGLGLLSKYTMGLMVATTVVFLLLDKPSRHWFRNWRPYLALATGFILFLPVFLWNAQHDWASFAFQGARRWSGTPEFSLHILIGSALVLITPLGVYEVVKVLSRFWKHRTAAQRKDALQFRKFLFLITFTMVPLMVFVIHSLQGQPKLNWTGPVWLAVLPLVAGGIAGVRVAGSRVPSRSISRHWVVTATALLVFYFGGFGYLVAGMPGMAKNSGMKFPIAWKAYSDKVEAIENAMKTATGAEPVVIGLDEYWLASEASFYDVDDADDAEALPEITGESLVGGNSVMWDSWAPPQMAIGRNGILVSFAEDRLKQSWVTRHFSKLGEIQKETLTNGGGEIGHFFWRLGYDYDSQ
ncbi:MAG: glycosyltransferase family 39 protein [candidate division Zixibacteria bacterium]|nr:glycosyltransferase family 39 protein [candidate division Zixibacteria bacterium]